MNHTCDRNTGKKYDCVGEEFEFFKQRTKLFFTNAERYFTSKIIVKNCIFHDYENLKKFLVLKSYTQIFLPCVPAERNPGNRIFVDLSLRLVTPPPPLSSRIRAKMTLLKLITKLKVRGKRSCKNCNLFQDVLKMENNINLKCARLRFCFFQNRL